MGEIIYIFFEKLGDFFPKLLRHQVFFAKGVFFAHDMADSKAYNNRYDIHIYYITIIFIKIKKIFIYRNRLFVDAHINHHLLSENKYVTSFFHYKGKILLLLMNLNNFIKSANIMMTSCMYYFVPRIDKSIKTPQKPDF